MNHYVIRRIYCLFIILTFPVFTLFTQSVSELDVLNFTEVLEESEDSLDFIIASEEYEKALLQMQLYSLSQDSEFGITPDIKSQWIEITDPIQTDISIKMDISIFTGRTQALENRYQAAVRNVEESRLKMEATLNSTVINLYNLYSTIWLLQQEGTILEKEKAHALNKYSGAYDKYIEGVLALSDLENAEEELQIVESAIQQNKISLRLTWFSFQQLRGKAENFVNPEIPVLEEFIFKIDAPGKPVSLADKVIASDNSILKLKNELISLTATAEELSNIDFTFNFKPYVSYDDYSANLTINPINRLFNISTSIPVISLNDSASQDSQKKWNAGMSVVFDFDTGTQNRVEKEIAEIELQQQENYINEQINKAILELRSVYQQFLQAQQNLEISENAYDRQISLRNAVQFRFDSGQALKSDLMSADIAVERSQWRLSSARVSLQKSYMALLALTGSLPF